MWLGEKLFQSCFVSSLRYGNSVLQASGLAQHGDAVISVPDQAELWGAEGAS